MGTFNDLPHGPPPPPPAKPKASGPRQWLTSALLLLATSLCPSPAAPMDLGGNFWNLGWHNPGDCFVNVREVVGENPWNPRFLQEIRIYRSLRFMDWDRTNGSERERWNQRPIKFNPRQNPVAYEGGQHLTKTAKLVNRDPAMAQLYEEYLRAMSGYFTHFCHYAHVGMAGENGAWGALEYTGQPIEDAPKYRALKAWAEQPRR